MLFTVRTEAGSDYLAFVSLRTGQRQDPVLPDFLGARYLASGHLLYASSGGLLAVPFDVERRRITGTARLILDRVYTVGSYGYPRAHFATSDNGSLIYVPGEAVFAEQSLVLIDRQGDITAQIGESGAYRFPRLSPDGKSILVTVGRVVQDMDLWVYSVERGDRTRLTRGGINLEAIWTPDGERVTFAHSIAGPFDLFSVPADRSNAPELLLAASELDDGVEYLFPSSWSADGRTLTLYSLHPVTQRDIWTLSLDGNSPVPRKVVSRLNKNEDERRFNELASRPLT